MFFQKSHTWVRDDVLHATHVNTSHTSPQKEPYILTFFQESHTWVRGDVLHATHVSESCTHSDLHPQKKALRHLEKSPISNRALILSKRALQSSQKEPYIISKRAHIASRKRSVYLHSVETHETWLIQMPSLWLIREWVTNCIFMDEWVNHECMLMERCTNCTFMNEWAGQVRDSFVNEQFVTHVHLSINVQFVTHPLTHECAVTHSWTSEKVTNCMLVQRCTLYSLSHISLHQHTVRDSLTHSSIRMFSDSFMHEWTSHELHVDSEMHIIQPVPHHISLHQHTVRDSPTHSYEMGH